MGYIIDTGGLDWYNYNTDIDKTEINISWYNYSGSELTGKWKIDYIGPNEDSVIYAKDIYLENNCSYAYRSIYVLYKDGKESCSGGQLKVSRVIEEIIDGVIYDQEEYYIDIERWCVCKV